MFYFIKGKCKQHSHNIFVVVWICKSFLHVTRRCVDALGDVFFLMLFVLSYSSLNPKEPLTSIGLEILQVCTYTYVMNFGKDILCCCFHISIMQNICVEKDLGHSQVILKNCGCTINIHFILSSSFFY